ncbi:MAG: F0F1 ATP synthase subunit gamma [Trueperaceae bacterium]|nr:F0F1 ATP synthase subunit gamma [Trueperaceae bacterium]
MASREVLRRQVRSTETLRSVVGTMKALASVRIGQVRRADRALEASEATLERAFQVLAQREPGLARALAVAAGTPAVGSGAWGAVLFGSDHGLCGPFNERLARRAAARLVQLGSEEAPPRLLVVGRRLRPKLAALGHPVERVVALPASVAAAGDAVLEVAQVIEGWQREHGVAQVFVVHHQPVSGVGYRTRTVQLLPLDVAWLRELAERPWPTQQLPMLGLEAEAMLRGLARQHVAHVLVRAFAASQAAENAARLAAMEAAERNVDERLAELRHAAAQERQNAVTEELLDVQAAFRASDAGVL